MFFSFRFILQYKHIYKMAANAISGLNGAQTSMAIGNDDMTSLSSKSSSSSSSCDDAGIDEHSIMLSTTVGDFDSVPAGRTSYSASSAATLQVSYCT